MRAHVLPNLTKVVDYPNDFADSALLSRAPNLVDNAQKNFEEIPGRGLVMDLIQAFLLGIMVAWTPSLILLAVLLWDVR
jgi:hypothetical protein